MPRRILFCEKKERHMNATMEEDSIYRFADGTAARNLVVGWSAEAVGAIVAVVLSAIGLTGVRSTSLAALAAISLGIGLLLEGVSLASCFTTIATQAWKGGESLEWGWAIIGKLLGGIAGVIAGTLVLLRIAAPSLLAVGVLVLGAAFLFTSMVSSLPGTQEIAGACAFALGLLAILGLRPLTLVLTAILGLAGIALLTGVASGSRLLSLAKHPP
jgi:hypothetical protein